MGHPWLLALIAGASGVTPSGQPPASGLAGQVAGAAPFWVLRNGNLTHAPTGMSFPDHVGDQAFRDIGIASHHGEGLDDGLEYTSAGRESFTTIYVFHPSLGDAGIEAAMVDHVILTHNGPGTRAYDDRIVAVGGRPGVARRVFYRGAIMQGRAMWSGAAILKIGGWLVEVRVSGPAAKESALERDFEVLLEGIGFSPETPPLPFHAIRLTTCAAPDGPAAAVSEAGAGDAVAYAFAFVSFDAGAKETASGEQRSDLTRLPDAWCSAPIATADGEGLRLWPAPGAEASLPVTRFGELIVLDDAGQTLEVSRINKDGSPWFLALHQIGGGRVLAQLDHPLSGAQMLALASGRLPLPARTPVTYSVDAWGKRNLTVPDAAAAKGVPTR